MKQWKKNISRAVKKAPDKIMGAHAGVEPMERRRLRLLSAFLILMTVITLVGSFNLKPYSLNTSYAMLATSGLLVITFFISRTRFYQIAIIDALILPAIPPIAVVIFKPPVINLTAELMWLSLPLLIASLMLTIRKSIIVAASYIFFINVLGATGVIGYETAAPLGAYMIAIAFFVITITAVREKNQSEIENQLKERQQAEKALRESEEKFGKAFMLSPQEICITSLKDGRTVEINESFTRLSGFTRKDIIGRTSTEVSIWTKPGDREKMLKLLKKTGRVQNEEFEFRDKNGAIRTHLFSAGLINFNGEDCIISIMTDITESKRAEEALRESEERFRQIFQQGPLGIMLSGLDYHISIMNAQFCSMFGYTEQELRSMTFKDFSFPEDAQTDLPNLQKLIKGELAYYSREKRYIKKTKELMWGSVTVTVLRDKSGKPLGFLAMIEDITQKKMTEQALADESTRRRILIEQSSDGIVVLDQNGKVYEANQRFADMLGYSMAELRQLHVFDWEFSYPRQQVLEMIQTIDDKGDHFETKHRRKDGTTYDVEISTNGAMFAGQKLIFCVCHDITERKQEQEKLKLAMTSLEHSTAQLQATNKELESFSYSVSHDLRSPLRSINGFSQALLEDYAVKLDDKGRDYLNRLCGASQKIGDLIDGLLKLSRLTRSEIHQENVDLGALAKEIIDRLKETYPERRVKFIIGSDDLAANGDPQMMRVLLENLLGNAWKFTAKTQRAEIELGRAVNGDKKTFFIRDNGVGFDMAFKDKLFGAFQRLHSAAEFPGTGIGLATVQRIINRHGGNIWAEGEVDKGATFYFNLN